MPRVSHNWYDELAKRLAKYINEKRANETIIAKELIVSQLKELGFKNVDRLIIVTLEFSEVIKIGRKRLYKFTGAPIYYRDILKRITALYFKDRKKCPKKEKVNKPEDEDIKILGSSNIKDERRFIWVSSYTW